MLQWFREIDEQLTNIEGDLMCVRPGEGVTAVTCAKDHIAKVRRALTEIRLEWQYGDDNINDRS